MPTLTELKIELAILEQRVKAREIVKTLSNAPSLPKWRAIGPTEASSRETLSSAQIAQGKPIADCKKAPARRLQPKSRASMEGQLALLIAQLKALDPTWGGPEPVKEQVIPTGWTEHQRTAQVQWRKTTLANQLDEYPDFLRELIKESRTKG